MKNFHIFLEQKYENNVYPCKPQFYYIKWGVRGSKLHGHAIMMNTSSRFKTCVIALNMCMNLCFITSKTLLFEKKKEKKKIR